MAEDDENEEKIDLMKLVRESDPDLADRFDFYKREAKRQQGLKRAERAGDATGRGCAIVMFIAICYGLYKFGGALGRFTIDLFK